jgi:hypothetical protein
MQISFTPVHPKPKHKILGHVHTKLKFHFRGAPTWTHAQVCIICLLISRKRWLCIYICSLTPPKLDRIKTKKMRAMCIWYQRLPKFIGLEIMHSQVPYMHVNVRDAGYMHYNENLVQTNQIISSSASSVGRADSLSNRRLRVQIQTCLIYFCGKYVSHTRIRACMCFTGRIIAC